jgi:DNA repair protein RecN (Recombination protein N)
MLTELKVKNYALIKDLLFIPGKEFNVITGETGAGKSILLGAMGLVLGERTDSVAIKENEEKCLVEATFQIRDYQLNNWFETNEFDYSEELIIRREISTGGKSRAFINDTPAQLNQLKELGKFLVDIHSQHDNLDLFQKEFQFGVLDSFSSTEKLQQDYKKKFDQLKLLRFELLQLEEAERKASEERDFKQFQYDELVSAQLQAGEYEKLEEEQLSLSSAENSLITLEGVKHQLTEADSAIVDQLALIRNQLNQVAKNDKRFIGLSERLDEGILQPQGFGKRT